MLLEQLLENLVVTVDAFATCRVAPGWRLRLPALDWVTFHYVVQGDGSMTDARGREVALPPGSLAVVPPAYLHTLECGLPPYGEASVRGGSTAELPAHRAGPEEEDGMVVACGRVEITYGGSLGLFDQLQDALVLDFAGSEAMEVTFRSMLEEARAGRPGAKAMTTALMRECLVRVFRELCVHEECRISWLTALNDPALAPVLDVMLRHPERSHSVASLAATAYMSRSVFARRFRESFGRPPLEYLRGVRLRHAAQLLSKSPSIPVATVARRAGFSSRSQFSRAFRDQFGQSPTQFRG
jgi:AraC-like DNA-binding protein